MTTTSIEWTANADGTPGKVWNPVRGCIKVSPGCKRCYAEAFAERWRGVPGHPYERGFDPRLVPEKLDEPLRWKKPQRVFVNSMSDLFGDFVPNEYIAAAFGVMAAAPRHTYIILTKRGERVPEWFTWAAGQKFDPADICLAYAAELIADNDRWQRALDDQDLGSIHTEAPEWPLPNVWLGVSVENRKHGLPRIEQLRQVPAAVRVLSIEPLLEDLGELDLRGIGWVLIGGESGHGARPFRLEWARRIIEQCKAQGVPCFFKQAGSRAQVGYYDDKTREQFEDADLEWPSPEGWSPEDGQPHLDAVVKLGIPGKGGDPIHWPGGAEAWPREFPEARHG